ncbi:hypothetical protein [uncultured Clostridium sp.]|uniref:hypothetical protein n=1 Tax=uncultured Clostridium sp. TaxID=59620 RepID=UPI0028EB6B8B|nr:hypothetical protein [uncultured Clostridium sp.]
MEKLKHSKIGLISFGVAFSPIICVVLVTIRDIFFPTKLRGTNDIRLDISIMIVALLIALIGLILGVVAITQKGYKKTLPISAVVISLLILSIPFIMIIKDISEIPKM